MFKRESEQPVKNSFEENNEKKKRRPLRERLSSIPVRRRIEAVILAVVTIMASLSIDWSSLSARAADDEDFIQSGQSISNIYKNSVAESTTITKLTTAKITVEIPSADKEVNCTWKVYQNLKDEKVPESGVEVAGIGGTKKIEYSQDESFRDCIVDLSKVVLLGDETAAVVFTLESEDGHEITYRIFDKPALRYVKNNGNWIENDSGKCVLYADPETAEEGALTSVTLSGVPKKLALTAGETYDFSKNSNIKWTPNYQRKLSLTTSNSTLIPPSQYPTFKVADAATIGNGDTVSVSVGGEGVTPEPVEVKVVSFNVNDEKGRAEEDKWVYTYTGLEFEARDLYKAFCGSADPLPVAEKFTSSYSGTLINGSYATAPLNAGSYTMTIEGQEDSEYAGLVYKMPFTIEPKTLTAEMFDPEKVKYTISDGKVMKVTGVKDGDLKLFKGSDFEAEIKSVIPTADKVTYKIKITGMNNYKTESDEGLIIDVVDSSGIKLDSVVGRIEFESTEGTYDATPQETTLKFYGLDGVTDITSAFTKGENGNYEVIYNGTRRSSGTEVKEATEIIDAGEYKATVIGLGTYAGSSKETSNSFVVNPIRFTTENVGVTLKKSSFEYSDSLVITPQIDDVTYKPTNRGLAEGTEYVRENEPYSKEVGRHLVTISGYGNYDGVATAEYTVFAPLLDSTKIAINGVTNGSMKKAEQTTQWDYVWTDKSIHTYTGDLIEPESVTANINNETLTVGSEAEKMKQGRVENNIDVTTDSNRAYFILTLPQKYAYKRIKVEFDITAKPLPADALSLKTSELNKDFAYGKAVTLIDGIDYFVVDTELDDLRLEEDEDYEITYENNINAGTATIIATGKGNYSGSSSKTFTIKPVDIKKVTIEINPQVLDTSGTVITDMSDVVLTMTDNNGKKIHPFTSDDFTLSDYKNNTTADESVGGKPQVKLTGKRNLYGSKVVEFEIIKEKLTGLEWRLSDSSIKGILGNPGTTVNLTDLGFTLDYVPKLSARTISLYYRSGTKFDSGNYTCKTTSPLIAGTNTITISGKGDYDGGEYYFTFEVNKLDISSDKFKYEQAESVGGKRPKFTLSYNGTALKEGDDYVTTVDPPNGVDETYLAGDSYKVTFTGKGSYTGTRTETFHIGKPFDKDHVFVTMYGPNGTKTVDGENRLTYFGNNDPYFILTSDKTDNTKTIAGPTYVKGAYRETDSMDYKITFSLSDSARHEVGAEVTVTFEAKGGGSAWYNPSGRDELKYTYKVVAGGLGNASNVGDLAKYLKTYTPKGTIPSLASGESMAQFPPSGGSSQTGQILIPDAFKYKYTTEPFDPEIHIYYDPTADSNAYATQSNTGKQPALPGGIEYSDAKEDVPVGNTSFFVPNKDKISASDTDKYVLITLKDGGWVTGPAVRVNYDFDPASLSEADITFNPANAEYTYSGEPAAVSYNVKIGNSNLALGTAYKVEGYFEIPSENNAVKTAIDEALSDPSSITSENISTSFGTNLNTAPTKSGNYVLVIGPVNGGHYDGYNIAKFSIATASFTAELAKSDFSVTYGDTSKTAPVAGDLLVTGVDGTTKLEPQTDETKDGYKIGASTGSDAPKTDAQVEIIGTGNYKGCTRYVQYKVVADISSGQTGGLPDFKDTNLNLTNEHMVNTNCLKLILKNDGGLPFIDGKETRFDPDKLTLNDGNVTIQSSYLKPTIAHADNNSGDNITSVGKKKITFSAASGAPVTGTREYYVEVFADISTADITLEANGATVKNDVISYTGQNISVTPVVRFRGSILDKNYYKNDRENGSYSYKDVNNYVMKLTGDGTYYYQGTAEKPFSIAYDLLNGVEIVYKKKETTGETYVPLSGMSFSYTGSPIGATIENSIKVRVKGTSGEFLEKGQGNHYTLDFANDTNPGGNTASATINSTGEKSFNSQTVYFSIGGSDLNETTCSIGLTPNTFVYDGTAKEPAVSVTYDNGSRQLVLDSDYKVTYSNNINVPASGAAEDQKPSVTVTGINGKYVGSITKTFDITAKQLTTSDVDFPDVPFGGSDASGNLLPATPTITVTSDGKTLVEGTDYEISYPKKQADETVQQYFTKDKDTVYEIKVTGKGNYSGEVPKTAKQLSGTLNSPNIIIDPSQPMTSVYNGRKVTFGSTGPVIRNGNSTLRYNVDYSIEIPEIINAGTYTIKITALEKGYYYDNGSSKTFDYTVTQRPVEGNEGAFVATLYDPLNGNVISENAGFAFTGEKIEPMVRLVDTGVTPDTSVVNNIWTNNPSLAVNPMMDGFTASYGDNKLAGEKSGSVTLTASGNYTGTITKYFNIGTDINNVTLSYDKTSADYDGNPKSQNITVSYNGKTLEAGTAYESPIAYTWKGGSTQTPTEVGEYTPIIKGRTDGGFYGEKQGSTFRIIAKNKSQDIEIRFNGRDGEVEAGDYVCHYNGKQQKPSITVYDTSVTPKAAIPSENYTVTYGNNINVGSGYVYVTLKGNYTGSAQEVFFIEPCDISNMTFAFAEGENGAIKNIPESSFPYVPLFKLTGLDDNGEEFELSYADSRLKQYFVIPDASVAKKPGKGSLTVNGTGNLMGSTSSFEYEVYGKLSESNVSVKPPVYTGSKKDPEVTVTYAGQTLVKDEDYSLRIVSSDQTGQAGGDVIVKGLGYFGGNVYVKYGESGDVSSLVLRGYSQQYVYSGRFAGPEESAIYAADSEGNQVIPADKLECTFASDVDAAACISAGATVTITSKATLDDGTVVAGPSATYKIVPRNISSCDIRQLTTDTYTGKGLTPPIAVSYDRKTYSGTVVVASDVIALVSGRDYSLNYRNNVYPGTAEITVTGKGNYTGTKRFMFTIKVPDMGLVTVKQSGSDTVVEWTARPHVSGYRILYNANGKADIVTTTTDTKMTLKDTVPSTVGVQAFVKDTTGKNTYYGAPKYVAVTR